MRQKYRSPFLPAFRTQDSLLSGLHQALVHCSSGSQTKKFTLTFLRSLLLQSNNTVPGRDRCCRIKPKRIRRIISDADCFDIIHAFPPAIYSLNILGSNCFKDSICKGWCSNVAQLVSLATHHAVCAMDNKKFTFPQVDSCYIRNGENEGDLKSFKKKAAAVSKVAFMLSSFPTNLDKDARLSLSGCLSKKCLDWIILAISVVNCVSSILQALGVNIGGSGGELTREALASIGSSWKLQKRTILNRLTMTVKNSRKEYPRGVGSSEQRKLPIRKPCRKKSRNCGVKRQKGSNLKKMEWVDQLLPVLKLIKNPRAVHAIKESVVVNMDSGFCSFRKELKCLIGIVFAGTNGIDNMVQEFQTFYQKRLGTFGKSTCEDVYTFSREDTDFSEEFSVLLMSSALKTSSLSEKDLRVLYLSKAYSTYSMSRSNLLLNLTIDFSFVDIMEVVSWISVLSLLSKLYIFYTPSE